MHHQTPLLAVQLSFLCTELEVNPGFISEQHRKAAEAPRKQKPHSSGTVSPQSQKGQLATVLQALSQGFHSQQLASPMLHDPCTPARKVLQVQRNHSNAARQYQCLSRLSAHSPRGHQQLILLSQFTMGTTTQLTVSSSNSPVVVTIFCTKTPARCR